MTRFSRILGSWLETRPIRFDDYQPTERAGFEPAVQLLTGHVFSKDAHSTTLPPLLNPLIPMDLENRARLYSGQ